MPMPSVEPTPFPPIELRFSAPDEAQEASYLAASEQDGELALQIEDGHPSNLLFLFCSVHPNHPPVTEPEAASAGLC